MKAIVSIPDQNQRRGTAIERALFALARAPAKGGLREHAKLVYPDDRIVAQIVERGAAPIGTTTGSGWAAELSQNLVGEFLATLAPLSAAAQLIAQGLQVRLGTAASMKLPARSGAPSSTVFWVGETLPIPVRSYGITDDCQLAPRKFGFIIGASREVARRTGGEAVLRALIREDGAANLDAAYFSTAASDEVTHAGMLSGIASIAGYAGGDRLAMETDLAALSEAVCAGGSGQVVFVVSPKRAARIRIVAPDLNRELTFLPSLAVADDTVIAVDPLSWAHGFGDDFDVDVSTAATLHMEDASPAEIVSASGPTPAAPVRSLWQTDGFALRLLCDVAFAPRRPNAAAWIEGATW
jgi:hypothetical protein